MDAKQFKNVVRQIVKEELQKNSEIMKPMIKECLGEMLLEQMAGGGTPSVMNNGKKARALREASYAKDESELEEYPTMPNSPVFNRSQLTEMLGYGDMVGGPSRGGSMITVDSMMTEAGTPVPISADAIPAHVINAMNRDYSEIVKAWNK